MPLRNLAWLLTVPALVALGLVLNATAPPPDKDYRLVRQVVDVLAIVDENYVKELSDDDRQKFVENMIDGGLYKLDPHSEYLNADRLRQFETASEGAFGGVGIVLGIDEETGHLKVDHPMPETPAYNAGVVAGDLIVRVGDTAIPPLPKDHTGPVNPDDTAAARITKARQLITGEVGTPVTLVTRRKGRTPEEQPVVLNRAKVEIHPIAGVARRGDDPAKWEWVADPQFKIAVIRIRSFSELVAGGERGGGELQAAVAEIEKAGGRAIILDLRENLGGLLDQAVKVSDLFLTEGRIVATRDRHGSERPFNARSEGTIFLPKPGEPRPMAVLVNRNSASASEIVAAALQDHNRAVVVGERSFGKGSVQRTFDVSKDPPAKIKLTIETYWRPSGRNIDRPRAPKDDPDQWGVRPNAGLEVPLTEEDIDQYAGAMAMQDWVAGKPAVVGPNPPRPPVPKGRNRKPLFEEGKPYEDKVQKAAIDYLRKELGGVGRAPAPLPGGGPLIPRVAA